MDAEQRRRQYVAQLEGVIKQMLTPLRGVPFNLVIEAMTGFRVLDFDPANETHRALFEKLVAAGRNATRKINQQGIPSKRANEVGNKIEPFVKNALNDLQNVKAETPRATSGKHKSTGYPDIEVEIDGVICYVECKTYNIENIDTTQRSFYFSPSDDFKVTTDALHFVMSFEMHSDQGVFRSSGFKLLVLENLSLDVKHEFNSDNRRLYSGKHGTRILHEEAI